jgi:regulator of protease activity HflC (stomatin/prohibitin superfamily)
VLDLLTQIVQFLWELMPRPTIVAPTEEAACYWFGRYGRAKGPGLYIIWPLIQYWRVHTVVSQICETAIIAVTSSDDKTWQWRIGIEYEISDILKYETMQFSGQNHLELIGGSGLVKIISQLTADEIKTRGVWSICNTIKVRISDSADQRGIKVLAVRPIMASQCVPVFLSRAERLVD